MIGLKLKPKKWGNSIAVIIPETVVKKANIEAGKPIDLLIPEKVSLQVLWGKLKTKKSTRVLKKEADRGWN